MASSSINEPSLSPCRDDESERFMEELENAIRSSPSIFKVPESVSRANPDAFLPRLIALGPLNGKNKMEFYKLYMAEKVRGELHLPEFRQLRTQLRTFKLRILASYNTHLEIDGHNLATVLLVDALFLLKLFLNVSAQMEDCSRIKFPLPNFDDQSNSFNIDHKMLLNDVLKLENQIPLLVFKGILPQTLKVKFPVLLYHFSQSLSPVFAYTIDPYEEISDICEIQDQSHHLLHFMYFSILIFPCMPSRMLMFHCPIDVDLALTFIQKWFGRLEFVLDFLELIGLTVELIGMVKKQILAHKTTSSHAIPSASHLQKRLVQFESAHGILCTTFTKTGHFLTEQNREGPPILFLPFMNINGFTETLFENLLAFEAMANINPPVFSLYLELMKALLPTPKDVQILKKNGIMTNHLDSDEEVVMLFKRLGDTISNLKNPTIRNLQPMTCSFERINKYEEEYKGMVEEINLYYDSFWSVKAATYGKKVLSFVWKMLGIIFIFFQILVMAKKFVTNFIGNEEPNYDYISAT